MQIADEIETPNFQMPEMTVKELNLALPCTSDVPPYTNSQSWKEQLQNP